MLIASLVALYFAIGAIAAVAGPAGSDIREEYLGVLAAPGVSKAKAMAYRAILMSAVILLWPILAPSAAKAAAEKRRRREPNLFELIDAMGQDGTDQDWIPGAVGKFGLSAANPIPTRSIIGSRAYLARLRTASGELVVCTRRGSTVDDAIERPIDVYDVRNEAGAPLATLFVSPYHRRNSALAPDGFRLAEGIGAIGERVDRRSA